MKREKVKVGLLGVGLDTYWKQFDELLSRLVGYQESISSQINVMDAEVVNVGMADTPEKAKQSALLLKQADVEIVFLYISTYALSSTILPIAQIVNKPIVMLNVQPTSRIDYSFVNSMSDRGKMTGEWLAHCQACSVPEFASVFNRAGIKYDIITGYLSDKLVWEDKLQEAGIIEHIAQSAAARIGYIYLQKNEPVPLGFIGSVDKLTLHRLPETGQELSTEITVIQEVFDITLISACVSTTEGVIAECRMKIFLDKK